LIKANNYNPNAMDKNIFELLHTSMIESGWTLPCVVASNNEEDKDKHPYVLIDGFHRVLIMSLYKDIYIREKGVVPCVVLNKDQNRYDRMFATILHNRCKGTHDLDIMSDIITELVSSGLSDYEIQRRLGMDKEELLRLKQLTGLASLFVDKEFSKSWKFEK
jgi:ParB-like chromosome segregation protein Spo0J